LILKIDFKNIVKKVKHDKMKILLSPPDSPELKMSTVNVQSSQPESKKEESKKEESKKEESNDNTPIIIYVPLVSTSINNTAPTRQKMDDTVGCCECCSECGDCDLNCEGDCI
jgi:hypothetical protein